MFASFPKTVQEALGWEWSQYAPYFNDLAARPLTAATVNDWLADASQLGKLLFEVSARLYIATTIDTTDPEIERRYHHFLETIDPPSKQATNRLDRKLLDSGLKPAGFEIPLRNTRAQVELFREENLPLKTQEEKLSMEYYKITSAQTVRWDGKELTLPQVRPLYQSPDRAVREQLWRAEMERRLQDRDALNDLWVKMLGVRRQIAANADCADFRAYKWRQLTRFDYTPDDCATFHKAIEQVVVPAAARIYERRRQRLGVDILRPWDGDYNLNVHPTDLPALKPFQTVDTLQHTCGAMFQRVDPELGHYFQIMRDEHLLDLDSRKGKAPGGYCHSLPMTGRSFIFMNAVGIHDDVQTMLHEAGHAFHGFESLRLPYFQQTEPPMEFCEVASMSMELLAAPYLPASEGGFYTEDEAARARAEHLEGLICFWPYMAVVDSFQHWVYLYPAAAADPAQCDAKWSELWDRFMVGIDYGGLEDIKMTGWHRKLHIFEVPFYYVEYGLAQLGAVQVWANALDDQSNAVVQYRKALSLGGMVTLPQLFATAGAKFAFDVPTMNRAIGLIENTLARLEA
jgi:oligoendopeptidase F